MTVNEKRDHSAQNVHSTIIGTEVNFVELQVNIPKGRAVATGAAGAAMAVPHFSRQVFNKVKGHLADRGNFAHVAACALVEDIGDLAVSTDAFCLPFSVLR